MSFDISDERKDQLVKILMDIASDKTGEVSAATKVAASKSIISMVSVNQREPIPIQPESVC